MSHEQLHHKLMTHVTCLMTCHMNSSHEQWHVSWTVAVTCLMNSCTCDMSHEQLYHKLMTHVTCLMVDMSQQHVTATVHEFMIHVTRLMNSCIYHALSYGVATVSRIDQIIGLFCRILSLLSGSFAKETCNSIDPTNQRHPIDAYGDEMLMRHVTSTCSWHMYESCINT